jgi:hypothetical protein
MQPSIKPALIASDATPSASFRIRIWSSTGRSCAIGRANYKRTEQIPTWPIDVSLALRFGTSQLIPLLSLTGLGKPIVDAIDRFGKFVAPS